MKNMKSVTLKSFAKNILLLIIVIAVMLILLEVVIRLFFPQNLNYTEFDSMLMYKHIPNFEVKYTRQEYSNEIRFNSKGLRDYEYSYEKPQGTFRMLLLGSSFSQAIQVPLEQDFENILEKKLNSNLKGKYELINGAVGGYGTAQELFFLKTDGLKYKPDLILLDFSMRDITENAISPLVSLENGKIAEHIPVKASLPKKILLFCSRYLHLCSSIQTVILNDASKNKFLNFLLLKSGTSSSLIKTVTKEDLFYKNYTQEANAAVEETFLLTNKIKNVADKNNIPLVMFIIPHREQVDDGKYKEFIMQNSLNEKELEYDKVQKLALKFAKDNNINFFDMLPYFRQKNINNTFYFNIDGHWNKQGHELAAELLYNYLLENRFVNK